MQEQTAVTQCRYSTRKNWKGKPDNHYNCTLQSWKHFSRKGGVLLPHSHTSPHPLQLFKRPPVPLCLLSAHTVEPLCFPGLPGLQWWAEGSIKHYQPFLQMKSTMPADWTFHTQLCWRILFLTGITLLHLWDFYRWKCLFCLIQGTLLPAQNVFFIVTSSKNIKQT